MANGSDHSFFKGGLGRSSINGVLYEKLCAYSGCDVMFWGVAGSKYCMPHRREVKREIDRRRYWEGGLREQRIEERRDAWNERH
jgi:hypothetical protein